MRYPPTKPVRRASLIHLNLHQLRAFVADVHEAQHGTHQTNARAILHMHMRIKRTHDIRDDLTTGQIGTAN